MQFTSSKQLEELLSESQYKVFKRVDYNGLPNDLREGVFKAEAVTSFGKEALGLFDNLCNDLGRLPTQKEFVDKGLPLYEAYWNKYQDSHKAINGHPFDKGAKLGCMNRLARNYISRVVETHLELLLKEMGFTVKSHPLIDSVMGVDLVIEDHMKRYYIHVTTSIHGRDRAEKSVMKKESRGSFTVKGKWVSFARDFSGDVILCYKSGSPDETDESTKWINNLPLFKKEYIEEYFLMAQLSVRKGEGINAPHCKLEYFKAWAKANLKEEISA